MIRIRKRSEPAVLRAKRQGWTRELRIIRAAGEDETAARRKYRDPQIIKALIAETNGKCCYCECLVQSRQYEPVEHVVPWSVSAAQAYKWTNLLLICGPCNTEKGEYFNRKKTIIDPSKFEPAKHLLFAGELVKDRAKSQFAPQTRVELKLNRAGLLETRKKNLANLLLLYNDFRAKGLTKVEIQHLKSFERLFLNKKSEYSACCTEFFSVL